jgi:uncharacterized protein with von Willebrand factor type A (vWA) domain
MSEDLTSAVLTFAASLRGEHGFSVASGQAYDALRAVESVGVSNRSRVRAALRTVLCSSAEEVARFDGLFESFFSSATAGVAQPEHAQRTRADRGQERPEPQETLRPRAPESREQDEAREFGAARTSLEPESETLAQAWMAMHARYSPFAAKADVASIPREGLDAAQVQANRLVASLHLGRSLRWSPQPHGRRLDLRRTLRESLRTGGDPVLLRRLGHPLRNPRFVVLLDGSRSMAEHAGTMLQYAFALCRRTRRASAFIFSTQLRDVSRELREAGRRGTYRIEDLGEAWGGGTRIGASLRAFVRQFGASLSDETFVVVFSDGLDVGETAELASAMREIRRRCAAIAWINPHAGEPGYAPSARGMQTAMPYVDVFAALGDAGALARGLRRYGSVA